MLDRRPIQLSAMAMLALYVILFFSILPWSPTIYKPILVEQFIYYFVLAVILIFVANSAKDIIGRSVGEAARPRSPRARLTQGIWGSGWPTGHTT